MFGFSWFIFDFQSSYTINIVEIGENANNTNSEHLTIHYDSDVIMITCSVDRGFSPWLGQAKDNEIGYLSTKHSNKS